MDVKVQLDPGAYMPKRKKPLIQWLWTQDTLQ